MFYTRHATTPSSPRFTRSAAGELCIVGYAALYYDPEDIDGTTYDLGDGVLEMIAPGAFSRALREGQNVRGLFNHDMNLVLGSTRSGTMQLACDARGLKFSIRVANTTIGRDLCEHIKRGDVSGCSFSFTVVKQALTEQKSGLLIRVLQDLNVYDVGPVTTPAYSGTWCTLDSSGSIVPGASRAEVLARAMQVEHDLAGGRQFPSSASVKQRAWQVLRDCGFR
jgi:HK97 family phage prohead protease